MSTPPRILLLSGYHAASHRYWCEQLISAMPDLNWVQLTLPDRNFYWRIRSNALTLAFRHREVLADECDLILATSMVDLCNLRGLLPHLGSVPSILYFHENQFVYPERPRDEHQIPEPATSEHSQPGQKSADDRAKSNLINAQLTTIYSALTADRLVFNSEFNQDTFINGANALFKKMPDGASPEMLSCIPDLSQVIPVPVQGTVLSRRNIKPDAPIEIVWNHRWEYDKQPQVFFAAMQKLLIEGVNIRLHVMGQSFRQVPECFSAFQDKCGDHIATWGFQSPALYKTVLQRAHVVVSSALHDFQGLGMLEAMAHGCIAIAPNRMAYPEYIPADQLYTVKPIADVEQETRALYEKFLSVISGDPIPEPNIERYLTTQVIPLYRDLFSDLLGQNASTP